MLLRQLFDHESSTYSYLIADEASGQAGLIDPVYENLEQYLQLCSQLGLKLVLALDTHVHADHVTALGALRAAAGCATRVGKVGDVSCASDGLADGQQLALGALTLEVLYTPGHTAESFCFYLQHEGEGYLFTGDTLLIRGTGRTDFQNGDAGQLYDSLHHKLLLLPPHTRVLPGHDYKGWTQSTLAEEKAHNPRLLLAGKDEFIAHMNNLNLPDPKKMDVAVPANMQCGRLAS